VLAFQDSVNGVMAYACYPASGIQDRLARIFAIVFAVYSVLVVVKLWQLLSIAVPSIPSDDQQAFLTGFLASPLIDLVFVGAIPLYASYRLGLLEFLINRERAPKQVVNKSGQTAVFGSAEPHPASSTDHLIVR
jgi:hypothetical protein